MRPEEGAGIHRFYHGFSRLQLGADLFAVTPPATTTATFREAATIEICNNLPTKGSCKLDCGTVCCEEAGVEFIGRSTRT